MEGSVRSLDKKASVAGIRCGIPSVIGGHRWERVVPVANIHSQTAKVLPTMLFEKVDSDSVQILFRFCSDSAIALQQKSVDFFGQSIRDLARRREEGGSPQVLSGVCPHTL